LPNERFLTTGEALGEDVVAGLAQLEDQVLQLDLLVAKADLTEKYVHPMDSVKYSAFEKYAYEHLEEHWASASRADDRHLCIDDVRHLPGRGPLEATIYPPIHMHLLGWWLAHAWRFIDLADTAIKSLDSWNITTAAIASRALIEEVSCLLYEADELSKRWSEAKSSPADDMREYTVGELLHDKLLEFTYASRGLGDTDPWPATNVMTYIQKLAKRYGHEGLDNFYTFLSNAAHPAVGAKMAYASEFPAHETGAYSLRRLSRRPTAAGRSSKLGFTIASVAANATITFGGENCRLAHPKGLLYQALSMVDDFGLTTRSGLLTRTRYWRKLMPGHRSSDTCPCHCGKRAVAKHRWGEPAPEIRVPRDWL
jgi:hypothetical protein